MASVPMQMAGSRPFLKYAVFALVGLMLAYVLFHTEHFLIDASDPSWPHYRQIAPWLLPHGLIGALALLLSFMQFSSRLRTQHPLLHRVSGRIYVAAVCLVAPVGVYIAYLDRSIGYTFSFTLVSAVFAALWLFATGMAFGFIRSRRVEQHRRFMTRSLAMALVFLEVRLIGGLTGWEDNPVSDTLVAWVCVALGYPIADIALQIEESLSSRKRLSV